MPSLRYLNTILTVLTVLLAMQLWTSWIAPSSGARRGTAVDSEGGVPSLVAPAQAQTSETGGIPNAGAQRREMIDLLKKQSQQMDQLITLLKSGEVRVRVEGGRDTK